MSNREENNSNFVRWCTSKSMQPTHRAAQAWQAACELKDKEIESLRHERNVLQKICAERSDELDALKSQKPIGYWRHTFAGKLCINKSLQCNIDGNSPELPDSTPLYARPVPAIPEGYALVNENSISIMGDSQYIAGMKFGWNCAVSNNESAFQSAIEGRVKERAMISAAQEKSSG